MVQPNHTLVAGPLPPETSPSISSPLVAESSTPSHGISADKFVFTSSEAVTEVVGPTNDDSDLPRLLLPCVHNTFSPRPDDREAAPKFPHNRILDNNMAVSASQVSLEKGSTAVLLDILPKASKQDFFRTNPNTVENKSFMGHFEPGFDLSQKQVEATIEQSVAEEVIQPQMLKCQEHHVNFLGFGTPYKSSTPPETSLAIIHSTPKADMDGGVARGDAPGSLHNYTILNNAWIFIDPVMFTGDRYELRDQPTASLREACARGLTSKVYQPCGSWYQDRNDRSAFVDDFSRIGDPDTVAYYNGHDSMKDQPTQRSFWHGVASAHNRFLLERKKNARLRKSLHCKPSPLRKTYTPESMFAEENVNLHLQPLKWADLHPKPLRWADLKPNSLKWADLDEEDAFGC